MIRKWFYLGCLLVLAASCNRASNSINSNDTQTQNGKLQVFTVNYPLAYFAERIGGDHVEVHFPAPVDVDPAFWKPSAEIVAKFQDADLILLNGADYAKWGKHASLPPSKLVNTTFEVSDQFIRIEDAISHQHGPSGEHAHDGIAFTTWLDLRIAVEQARAVKDALVKSLPNQRTEIESNFEALQKELMALDTKIEGIVSTHRERPLVVSHPVYQYFTRRFGLNVKSVHWEPDVVPNEESWSEFETLLESHPAKWMIWEDEPTNAASEKLAAIGIKSVVYKPAGNRPAEGDFLNAMRENIEQLKLAFQ